MKFTHSTLFKVFNALDPEELKALQKAIQSPFFNYRLEEIRLFDFLLLAKKTNRTDYAVEDVCSAIFPKQKPDTAKLRHVMTYLLRIIYRCLNISEFEKDETLNRLLLSRTLRRKKLNKQFLAEYNETLAYYNGAALIDSALYYHRLLLNTEHYAYTITDRRPENANLKQLSDDLDSFFVIQKLKQACNILSYKNIFKNDYQPELLPEVLELVKRNKLLSNPLINLLYYSYQTLAEPDDENHFMALKKTLLHDSGKIETNELKDVFTLAINYCIKRLNTGNYSYYQQVFDVYKAGLEKDVFTDEGKFSPFTYKNIASIALGLKEFDWALGFIDKYRLHLDDNLRDGFYAYCLARYFFIKHDYNRVTDLLQEVEIKDVFTEIDSRVLLIKAYYEMDEYNLMGYAIENLKQLIKRRKMQTYHEQVYTNFVRMVKKLLSIKQYDKTGKQLFLKKLDSITAMAEKDWMRSKISV